MQRHFHSDLTLNIYSSRELQRFWWEYVNLVRAFFLLLHLLKMWIWIFFVMKILQLYHSTELLTSSCKRTWVDPWTWFSISCYKTCSLKGAINSIHTTSLFLFVHLLIKIQFDHSQIHQGGKPVPFHPERLQGYYYL